MTFSSLIIYKFLFFAFLLFAFFRVLFFLNPILIKNKKNATFIKRNLPVLEFIVWIIFSVWVFREFLIYNQYFAIALFVIMLVISILSVRIFLSDFVAGIILKSDSSISTGDFITTSNFSGIISKFNYRTLELELQNKSIAKIPYSEILNKSLVKEKRSRSISAHSFEITTSKKKKLDELIKSIEQTIILLPWVSIKQTPEIKPVSETNNTYLLEITIFANNKDMYFKIEKFIKEKIEG
ncbi:MAG: mechanosensitive ion channel family protein [Bacteroidales bacterium]|nr:mechanosensitive ion channel family protein [Bacteroidales bacterium]